MSTSATADGDDPIALPFPAPTVLLEHWSPRGFSGSAVELALLAIRQQQQELGIPLAIATPSAGDSQGGSHSPGAGDSQGAHTATADAQAVMLHLEGFRVQLICAPFWSDALTVPCAPWQQAEASPHLLLAAWVDAPGGAVHVPGVLTAAEALAAQPLIGSGSALASLPVSALNGGLDRLFSLIQLLEPAQLVVPRQRAAQNRESVSLLSWLEGQLGAALAPFAPHWVPAEAHAFRSAAAAGGLESLGAVAIPLALVAGRVRWGDERLDGSERFQLLLSLRGREGRPERLEVRLEPNLSGDLLPEHLVLVVGDQSVVSDDQANRGPLVLSAATGDAAIEIRLERAGVTELQLPPMILATPSLPD